MSAAGLVPSEVVQHHHARQDHRRRVDDVLAGVLRRRAMRRLEEGDLVARCCAPGAMPRPPTCAAQRIRQVVAVQVRRGEDVVLAGARQDLLEHAVGDAVVDEQLAFARRALADLVLGDDPIAELGLRQLVAPVAEGPFGELHDVALMHDGDELAVVGQRVLNRHPHEALGARLRHGLDADAGIRRDTLPHLLGQELDDALGLRRALGKLDARVDVFGVLAEDDDVHPLGVRDRRRRTREVPHRTKAGVQVEHLPQRHVQAADAAADRRRQRSLDCDFVSLATPRACPSAATRR